MRSSRGNPGYESVQRVSFGEDASTVRKNNAPQNLSCLKKIVFNRIRLDTADKSERSLRLKRKRAASKEGDVRMRILGLNSLGLTSQPCWRLSGVQSMHEQRNKNDDRDGYAWKQQTA